MSRHTLLFKHGNCTRLLKIKNKMKIGWFTNKVGKNSRYFVGVFNRIIIPLALVGYEMITPTISYVTHTRGISGIIVNHTDDFVIQRFYWISGENTPLSLMTVLCLIPQATSYVAGRVGSFVASHPYSAIAIKTTHHSHVNPASCAE